MDNMPRLVTCMRCGYQWLPRRRGDVGPPARCAGCQSRDWRPLPGRQGETAIASVPCRYYGPTEREEATA